MPILLSFFIFIINNDALIASNLQSPELSVLFKKNTKFWDISATTFMKIEGQNGFDWNSKIDKKSARSTNRNLSFLGHPVFEAIAKFDDKGVYNLSLSLYNRGDAGWVGDAGLLTEEGYENYLKKIIKSITKWTNSGGSKSVKNRLSSKIYSYRKNWIKDVTHVDVKWSSTEKHKVHGKTVPFRIEYIKVELGPSTVTDSREKLVKSSSKNPISISNAKSKVRRRKNNDIYLDGVPMVDQGNKNYCAVATLSRIMGYYGKQYDQHEIAQMVDTNFLGTNPDLMLDALQKLGFKLGVKVRIHKEFDMNTDFHSESRGSYICSVLNLFFKSDISCRYATLLS